MVRPFHVWTDFPSLYRVARTPLLPGRPVSSGGPVSSGEPISSAGDSGQPALIYFGSDLSTASLLCLLVLSTSQYNKFSS